MKLHIFAVKDRALNAFMTPWFAQTVNQAIRMFQDEVNNPQGQMIKHPDDYDLYHLGSWNDDNGNFTNIENDQIAIGKNMVNSDAG